MRLTERKVCYPECDKQGNITKVVYVDIKDKKMAEEKLCQLEDIEEELGIDLAQINKELEALEIIKEKRVNVQALFYSSSCEDYNKHYTHYEDLTQEEYDLLKEVLSWQF